MTGSREPPAPPPPPRAPPPPTRHVVVRCTVGEAPAVAAALTAAGWGTTWIDEPLVQHTDDEGYVLDAPAPGAPAAVHAWPTRDDAPAPRAPASVRGHPVELVADDAGAAAVDWETAWRDAHPSRIDVAPGWALVPPWARAPGDARCLVIEPGGAFGTGAHPTTRDSLAALFDLARAGAAVLDLGTGSGVLAIAAVRWGAGEVVGVDIDGDAVALVAHNAALNGLPPGRVPVHVGDGAELLARLRPARGGGWDVVLCNVGTAEVVRALPLARAALAEGGAFVASGVYAPSAARVAGVARAHGLRERAPPRGDDEWRTLVFARDG